MNNEITIDGIVYVRKDLLISYQVKLYQSEKQKDGEFITTANLFKEVKKKGYTMLGQAEYDYFAADFSRIPKAWEGKAGETRWIIFGNAEFRDYDGDLCVRALCWGGCQWNEYFFLLGRVWDGRDFVAVLLT